MPVYEGDSQPCSSPMSRFLPSLSGRLHLVSLSLDCHLLAAYFRFVIPATFALSFALCVLGDSVIYHRISTRCFIASFDFTFVHLSFGHWQPTHLDFLLGHLHGKIMGYPFVSCLIADRQHI